MNVNVRITGIALCVICVLAVGDCWFDKRIDEYWIFSVSNISIWKQTKKLFFYDLLNAEFVERYFIFPLFSIKF